MSIDQHQPKLQKVSQAYQNLHLGTGSTDLHYQICSTFLKNSGEYLNKNELRMMTESNKLIDILHQSKKIREQNQKSQETLSNTTSYRTRHKNFMDLNSDNIESRLLARKSPKGNTKYLSIAFSDEVRDIQENCNSRTIKSIKSLIDEHKKLKDQLGQIQIKQKKYERRIETLLQQQEKFLILKKIQQQNEKKIKKLQATINQLKNKNKSQNSSSQDLQKIKQNPPPLVDPKMLTQLTNYLNQKERSIDQKMKRVQDIQENILRVVGTQFAVAGCQKCCTFLRKIKQFMIKLRRSLQAQTEDIEKIYNRYKTIFCFTHS